MDAVQLVIDGLVARPLRLSWMDLQQLDNSAQIDDVSTLGARRPGRAVRLAVLLDQADALPAATHLGLHAERDNFHASIPLAPVRQRAIIIYAVGDRPLAADAGGPFRLFIPDHAACQADEIDECANVKFLDRIELTQGKGLDNRPQDEIAHARLHHH